MARELGETGVSEEELQAMIDEFDKCVFVIRAAFAAPFLGGGRVPRPLLSSMTSKRCMNVRK